MNLLNLIYYPVSYVVVSGTSMSVLHLLTYKNKDCVAIWYDFFNKQNAGLIKLLNEYNVFAFYLTLMKHIDFHPFWISALFNSIDSIAVQSEQVVVAMETKPCDEKPEIITSFSNLKGLAEFHHSSSGNLYF